MSNYISSFEEIKKLVNKANELALPFPDKEGFQKEVRVNLRKPGAQTKNKNLAEIKLILIDLKSKLDHQDFENTE